MGGDLPAAPPMGARELFPTIAGKNQVAQLLAAVPGLTRKRERTVGTNGGTPRRRGRCPFFTEKEEAAMFDALALWAAQGLMLTSETLRSLPGAFIEDMGPARYETAQGYFWRGATTGRQWFELFLGRHPELRSDRPAPLEAALA